MSDLFRWDSGQSIPDNSITTEKIVDGAVTDVKIADDAVSTAKIEDGAISTEKIINEAITGDKIATDAVSTEKIVDGAVTAAKLATFITPSARVYNNTAIPIPHNTTTELPFNSKRWDNNSIHSTTTNNRRLTCRTAGLYSINGHVQFASNATGSRVASILLNGTHVIANMRVPAVSDGATVLTVSTVWSLAVGNYVELRVYQTSGGNLDVLVTASYSPEFGMTYLGKVS
jgi:hypothetical protein